METKFLEIKHFPDNLKAKNVIFVVGDGAGFSQITLSRIVIGGLDYRLAIDQLPIQGASLTHPFGNVVTDSAAAGTAWATGNKTKNRYLSVEVIGLLGLDPFRMIVYNFFFLGKPKD